MVKKILLSLGAALLAAVAVLAFTIIFPGPAGAGESLKAGDAAPDVTFALHDGSKLKLREAKRPLVVYFYPKDDTPGCTREACTFRDRTDELARTGALVVGVSFDDAESHKKFREKHKLPFSLATDDGTVAPAFGVTVRGVGSLKFPSRDTFVIGADAKILAVMRGVDPVESIQEVLEVLQKAGVSGEPKTGGEGAKAREAKGEPKAGEAPKVDEGAKGAGASAAEPAPAKKEEGK